MTETAQMVESVEEVFDKSLPFKWLDQQRHFWRGIFTAPSGDQISLTIELDPHIEQWEVGFFRAGAQHKSAMGILNTGDAFPVFTTVIKMLLEWIKKIKPEFFNLSAEEPSRVKLYSRMLSKLLKGYSVTQHNRGGGSAEFKMERK